MVFKHRLSHLLPPVTVSYVVINGKKWISVGLAAWIRSKSYFSFDVTFFLSKFCITDNIIKKSCWEDRHFAEKYVSGLYRMRRNWIWCFNCLSWVSTNCNCSYCSVASYVAQLLKHVKQFIFQNKRLIRIITNNHNFFM